MRKIRGEAHLESVFAHPLMRARRVREHDEDEEPLASEISELTLPAMAIKLTGRMPQIAITAGSF